MSDFDRELSEFCASAVREYGRTEVFDAVCKLMTTLALETESDEYFVAIDDAVATRDVAKSEALSREIADFLGSIFGRYGEKTSTFELIASIAAATTRSRDNDYIRQIGKAYYEKCVFYRKLLRKARH